MISRPFTQLAIAASLTAVLTACGKDSDSSYAVDDSVEVPSAAELEAEAAEAIDASNADEEFDKLKSEIESGS